MGKIGKGSAVSTAILGSLAFALGLGVAICSWSLNNKISGFSMETDDENFSSFTFNSYWWGGLFYCLPGIIGITVGCTRNVCAMICYLVVNLLCMLCSVVVTIFCAVIMLAWAALDVMYENNYCQNMLFSKGCKCEDGGNEYIIKNVSCNDIGDIKPTLSAIVVMASLASFIAFIASYISCCGLCSQEPDMPPTVFIQQQGQQQQQPNIIISNNSSTTQQQQFFQQPQQQYAQPQQQYAQQPQQQYAQQPPPMYAQQPPPVYSNQPTHDKAELMRSEVV